MSVRASRTAPTAERYEVLGYPFAFATTSPTCRRRFRLLFGVLPPIDAVLPAPLFTLCRGRQDGHRPWRLTVDGGEPLVTTTSRAYALGVAETEILSRVHEHRRDLIWMHGALVDGDRGSMLICGASGAGKSTLAMSLVTLGHRVGSDDVALLDPRTLLVRPLPRAIHLVPRSRRILGRRGRLVPGRRHGFPLPPRLAPEPGALRHLLFLEPGPATAPPRLVPMSQAEAVGRLALQSDRGAYPPAAAVGALGRLTGRAECYRLIRGGIWETAGLVAALLVASRAAAS